MKFLKPYSKLNEERDYDNIHSKYPYNCIVIQLNNLSNIDECMDIFNSRLTVKDVNDLKYILHGYIINGPCYARLYYVYDSVSGVKKLQCSGNLLDKFNHFTSSNSFVHEKIFTINDLRNGLIERLIKDGEIAPSYKPKKIIRESIRQYLKPKSEEDIIKLCQNLSKDEKLIKGCELGILSIVKQSLEEGANPRNGICFSMACKYGHIDIVKLLLKDKRINPSAMGNEAIWWASEKDNKEILKLLVNDERIKHVLTKHNLEKYTRQSQSLK